MRACTSRSRRIAVNSPSPPPPAARNSALDRRRRPGRCSPWPHRSRPGSACARRSRRAMARRRGSPAAAGAARRCAPPPRARRPRGRRRRLAFVAQRGGGDQHAMRRCRDGASRRAGSGRGGGGACPHRCRVPPRRSRLSQSTMYRPLRRARADRPGWWPASAPGAQRMQRAIVERAAGGLDADAVADFEVRPPRPRAAPRARSRRPISGSSRRRSARPAPPPRRRSACVSGSRSHSES